ncbi:MAG: ATPase [Acidobacteriales bacterium]|nr:ATPase [Terriglobales bacterium]
MYLESFGLRENPFTLVTDPRFLYYSESHCDAMAHLLYGVRERKGIILMLGEAGTGKTTLVKATLEMLRSTRVVSSVILNPILSGTEDFFDLMLRGFGLDGFKRNNVEMADMLQRFLVQQSRRGRIPVIVVDEGQELARPYLEQIRMLSNYEDNGQKLVQFVIAAQPEMSEKIESFELRALRQRITVRCRLSAMSPQETWTYLYSRLERAGCSRQDVFVPAAVELIYAYSGGIPRIINSIADNCLLASFARSASNVDAAMVQKVARHLELKESASNSSQTENIHRDVLKASSTWREVAGDIRTGAVPEALKKFVEKLQTNEDSWKAEKVYSAAIEQGE